MRMSCQRKPLCEYWLQELENGSGEVYCPCAPRWYSQCQPDTLANRPFRKEQPLISICALWSTLCEPNYTKACRLLLTVYIRWKICVSCLEFSKKSLTRLLQQIMASQTLQIPNNNICSLSSMVVCSLPQTKPQTTMLPTQPPKVPSPKVSQCKECTELCVGRSCNWRVSEYFSLKKNTNSKLWHVSYIQSFLKEKKKEDWSLLRSSRAGNCGCDFSIHIAHESSRTEITT